MALSRSRAPAQGTPALPLLVAQCSHNEGCSENSDTSQVFHSEKALLAHQTRCRCSFLPGGGAARAAAPPSTAQPTTPAPAELPVQGDGDDLRSEASDSEEPCCDVLGNNNVPGEAGQAAQADVIEHPKREAAVLRIAAVRSSRGYSYLYLYARICHMSRLILLLIYCATRRL